MTLAIDLVPHLDAGDRKQWSGDQGERPLSELGRQQARALVDALAVEPIDALYSGPALRCRQSLAPLAERLGLTVAVLPELGEQHAWRNPEGWELGSHEMAFAAGKVFAGIGKLRALYPEGRVVACSHGHVIPALITYLIATHDLGAVAQLSRRSQWYRLRFVDDRLSVELQEAPGKFPA